MPAARICRSSSPIERAVTAISGRSGCTAPARIMRASLQAVHAGQIKIEQRDIEACLLELDQRSETIRRMPCLMAHAGEQGRAALRRRSDRPRRAGSPRAAGAARCDQRGSRDVRRLRFVDRQIQIEHAALAERARHRDAAAHQRRQIAADRKPQAAAAVAFRHALGLLEAVEESRAHRLAHAGPGVADAKPAAARRRRARATA